MSRRFSLVSRAIGLVLLVLSCQLTPPSSIEPFEQGSDPAGPAPEAPAPPASSVSALCLAYIEQREAIAAAGTGDEATEESSESLQSELQAMDLIIADACGEDTP